MNECLMTPQHENRSAIGCQNKVDAWNGYIFLEWMFNDTPACKQIGYWVSEQGRCMKWLYFPGMNEWMFNDTPARKQIGYWVSE